MATDTYQEQYAIGNWMPGKVFCPVVRSPRKHEALTDAVFADENLSLGVQSQSGFSGTLYAHEAVGNVDFGVAKLTQDGDSDFSTLPDYSQKPVRKVPRVESRSGYCRGLGVESLERR